MISLFHKKKIRNIEAEFVEMIEENKDKFYRIALSYVKNEHDALDIVQESVCKGYIALDKLNNQSYMKTWFTRIIINTSINTIKKSDKFVLYEDTFFDNDRNIKDLKHEEKIDLNIVLDTLKEKEKAIVVLRFFEEYKFEEIAQILDEPINTVKATLYRSLKKMKLEF